MRPLPALVRQGAPIVVALVVMALLALVLFRESLGEFLATLIIVVPGSLLGVLLGRRRREERRPARRPDRR